MADPRATHVQQASEPLDDPGSGTKKSKPEESSYDDEFPTLVPAPVPVLGTAGGRDDRAGDDAREEAASPGVRPSQSTTVDGGSPAQKSGPHHFAADYADSESSSELWDSQPERLTHRGRSIKTKRQDKQATKRRPWGAGGLSSLRGRSGESAIGFGDDLDERSESGDRDSSGSEDGEKTGWRVRLAPWNTPLPRRLQTLVVLMHCMFMGATFTLFCFLCTVPLLWPVIIVYLIYIRLSTAGTDGKDTLRCEAFRRSRIWKYFAGFYPAALHKTADLPPTRKYILAVHPHGIISHGAWAAFASEALGFAAKFPGVTNHLLTLNGNFKTPFYREYLLAMGLQSVSKESITNILTKGGTDGEGMGRAVSIVIGGAREALEAQPKTMRLIMSRKGFCRMALRTGADLVPVLVFGENDLYHQWSERDHPRFHRLQMKFLALMGFSVPVLQGRGVFNYDFGILPHRRPLNVVVGAPIPVQQVKGTRNPDQETEDLHRLYCKKLVELYEAHKDLFAPNRKEEMQFID